jgi:hypothetical protein
LFGVSELDSAGFPTPVTGSPFLRADNDQFSTKFVLPTQRIPSKPKLNHLNEVIFVTYRAIAQFDAVFGDQRRLRWSTSEFAQLDACECGSRSQYLTNFFRISND